MADNFNLAKFLRNNQLLNESIGGYKDIKLLREAYIKLGDTFKIKGEDYKVVATNDDNDLDPRDFVGQIEGFDPKDFVILYKLPFVGGSYGAWQENPSAEAVILSIEDGEDEFIIKKHSELSGGINEAEKFDQVAPVEEGEEEQAYFDYKRSEEDDIDDVDPLPSLSPKFNISQDDFFGRMMDLAHEEFMGISDIVSMTIDSLRHGGFDDRDILNFLATDFSLDEEVSGVGMEEAMIRYDSDMQEDGKTYIVDLGFKSFVCVYDADNEQFIPEDPGMKPISKYNDRIKGIQLYKKGRSPYSDISYRNKD